VALPLLSVSSFLGRASLDLEPLSQLCPSGRAPCSFCSFRRCSSCSILWFMLSTYAFVEPRLKNDQRRLADAYDLVTFSVHLCDQKHTPANDPHSWSIGSVQALVRTVCTLATSHTETTLGRLPSHASSGTRRMLRRRDYVVLKKKP